MVIIVIKHLEINQFLALNNSEGVDMPLNKPEPYKFFRMDWCVWNVLLDLLQNPDILGPLKWYLSGKLFHTDHAVMEARQSWLQSLNATFFEEGV